MKRIVIVGGFAGARGREGAEALRREALAFLAADESAFTVAASWSI